MANRPASRTRYVFSSCRRAARFKISARRIYWRVTWSWISPSTYFTSFITLLAYAKKPAYLRCSMSNLRFRNSIVCLSACIYRVSPSQWRSCSSLSLLINLICYSTRSHSCLTLSRSCSAAAYCFINFCLSNYALSIASFYWRAAKWAALMSRSNYCRRSW